MNKKRFVLDTNVLLHDPKSIYSFEDNDVIIILSILGEIDDKKTAPGELGANAREVARILESLGKGKKLADGVELENGGTLYVYPRHYVKLTVNHEDTVDSKILAEAKHLMNEGENAIIVSKDTILRVMANGLGIPAEDYETDKKETKEYSGIATIETTLDVANGFAYDGSMPIPEGKFYPNQFVLVSAGQHPILGIVESDLSMIKRVNEKIRAFNIRPRNLEQTFAIHALMDDNIKLVTLQGRAGTGKTLLAVAAGLAKYEEGEYARMVVTRPVIPVGRDIGFLPGDMEEKMHPWMQPIYDSMDMIKMLDSSNGKSKVSSRYELEDNIQVAPLVYIRGRSIPHGFMIVDEAQNLTPLEVKTLVTRCGEGTKVVFTGDIDQIDNPYVDRKSNGFVSLVTKFMGDSLHAHVHLKKGERSELAARAAKIL